jgi:hypothetical protein
MRFRDSWCNFEMRYADRSLSRGMLTIPVTRDSQISFKTPKINCSRQSSSLLRFPFRYNITPCLSSKGQGCHFKRQSSYWSTKMEIGSMHSATYVNSWLVLNIILDRMPASSLTTQVFVMEPNLGLSGSSAEESRFCPLNLGR